MPSSSLIPLPARSSAEDTQRALADIGSWFYEFDFVNGAKSAVMDETAQRIHDARMDLVFPLLDAIHGDRWERVRCIDIACNEGWFAMQVAARGAREVRGFDLRVEHIARAKAIKDLSGIQSVQFDVSDLFEVDIEQLGQFDLTLCLGLLYHLDGPMPALRRARALTCGTCVIETQVARSPGMLEAKCGSGENFKYGGAIAVLPANGDHVAEGLGLALVPTVEALNQMLYAVGFSSVQLAVAAPDAYAQYVDVDRVVVFAHA